MGGRVLVLNATYEPINVCTVRRAVVLLLKEKAELVERGRWELHSESSTLARPVVIRLVTYVNVPRDAHRRKITRRAVFARDSWTCQYCGSRSNLTVDHVIPRSKGGSSSWENIVASCAPCNRRKGDRLPRQAGMHPRHARARRAPRSSSMSPARRSRRPGCSTCRRRPDDAPEDGEGRLDGAPFAYCSDWKTESDAGSAGGTRPAVVSGCPGLDSAKRTSLSDLAAGHLQGPARTVRLTCGPPPFSGLARLANGR